MLDGIECLKSYGSGSILHHLIFLSCVYSFDEMRPSYFFSVTYLKENTQNNFKSCLFVPAKLFMHHSHK
jgi:hypothetical protein